MGDKKHNRRTFFKIAGAGIVAGTAFLWERLVRSQKQLSQKGSLLLPFNPNQEYTFHEDAIVLNQKGKLAVYSSKCTHLGCTIKQSHNGELVCPCHGSKFNARGEPLKGPAVKPLQKLVYVIDEQKGQIIIER